MNKLQVTLDLIRISLGTIFLWAFLDKLLGLGFATEASASWINGSSPTTGYLTFATTGPFAKLFQALAGNVMVDILFMSGLLFVGLTLILGILVRLGSLSGIAMLLLIYLSSALPPEHHPVLDDHLIYSLMLIAIIYANHDQIIGLGQRWNKLKIVANYAALR